jgi:two-component system response regulator WspF
MSDAAVAWVAEDGRQAVDRCREDRPDIVLMDMIMPVMDGVEATRRIMAATPCPILVVTATVEGNASKVFEALGAGALDAVATPVLGADGRVVNADALIRKIRAVALLAGSTGVSEAAAATPASSAGAMAQPSMLAIGSSTGGPFALSVILKALPRPAPWPIVVVQHVDESFAAGLASWLGAETGHRVEIIAPGQMPQPGKVHLAATGDHLLMGAGGRLRYSAWPTEQVYRPSVDVFFDSLLAGAAPGIAVVLTGMGRDGALGMSRLRGAGWHTIAQDRATSVVWGMPGACVELGAAVQTLPLNEIGPAIAVRMMAGAPTGPTSTKATTNPRVP